MDIISFNEGSTANGRIENFIENPDSTSGVVTVPSVIAAGETITIPAGRTAVLPNIQIDGTLNVDGTVFIPSGSTLSGVVEKVTSTDNAIVRFNGTTGDVQNSAITVDDLGNVGSGSQSFNGFGGSGFKNYIINGGFGIWQRGTSQTASGYGSADRWSFNNVGTSTRTIYKTIATDTDRPYFNSSGILATTLTTLDTTTTSRAIRHSQPIEDVTRLAGKTVTLSFWARATVAMPIETTSQQVFGTGGSPSSAVVSNGTRHQLTTGWQKFSTTVTIPSILGKTIGTDGVHTSCTNIKFHLMADSATATSEGLTGTLQPANGTIVFIAEVQLEEGSIATPFEQRPYGLELSLCQRYYETGILYGGGFIALNAGVRTGTVYYNSSKRTAASIALSNIAYTNCNSLTAENSSLDGFGHYVSAIGTNVYGVSATFTASAEF